MQRTETARLGGAEQRGVLELLRSLVDSGVDLAHNTARMAASEGRVVLQRVAVRLALFVAGLFVAAVGLLLALIGVALVLARLVEADPWVALVAVGLATLAAGAIFAIRAMQRLGDPDIAFEATLAEIGADVAMLRRSRDAHEEGTP